MKPKNQLTKKEVIWAIYANHDDSATLHHCLYDIERKSKWTGDISIVNAALCNKKHHVYNENEMLVPIAELTVGCDLKPYMACKTCLKIYDKLPD